MRKKGHCSSATIGCRRHRKNWIQQEMSFKRRRDICGRSLLRIWIRRIPSFVQSVRRIWKKNRKRKRIIHQINRIKRTGPKKTRRQALKEEKWPEAKLSSFTLKQAIRSVEQPDSTLVKETKAKKPSEMKPVNLPGSVEEINITLEKKLMMNVVRVITFIQDKFYNYSSQEKVWTETVKEESFPWWNSPEHSTIIYPSTSRRLGLCWEDKSLSFYFYGQEEHPRFLPCY